MDLEVMLEVEKASHTLDEAWRSSDRATGVPLAGADNNLGKIYSETLWALWGFTMLQIVNPELQSLDMRTGDIIMQVILAAAPITDTMRLSPRKPQIPTVPSVARKRKGVSSLSKALKMAVSRLSITVDACTWVWSFLGGFLVMSSKAFYRVFLRLMKLI